MAWTNTLAFHILLSLNVRGRYFESLCPQRQDILFNICTSRLPRAVSCTKSGDVNQVMFIKPHQDLNSIKFPISYSSNSTYPLSLALLSSSLFPFLNGWRQLKIPQLMNSHNKLTFSLTLHLCWEKNHQKINLKVLLGIKHKLTLQLCFDVLVVKVLDIRKTT